MTWKTHRLSRPDSQKPKRLLIVFPPQNKKSDKKFVAALLRLMYPEEYFATHTTGANLTGKPSMDEKEITQIIGKLAS